MKNPFEKEDHSILIASLTLGVIAGAGIAYLFLTEKGTAYLKQITSAFTEKVSEQVADVISKKTIIPKKAAKIATDAAIKRKAR